MDDGIRDDERDSDRSQHDCASDEDRECLARDPSIRLRGPSLIVPWARRVPVHACPSADSASKLTPTTYSVGHGRRSVPGASDASQRAVLLARLPLRPAGPLVTGPSWSPDAVGMGSVPVRTSSSGGQPTGATAVTMCWQMSYSWSVWFPSTNQVLVGVRREAGVHSLHGHHPGTSSVCVRNPLEKAGVLEVGNHQHRGVPRRSGDFIDGDGQVRGSTRSDLPAQQRGRQIRSASTGCFVRQVCREVPWLVGRGSDDHQFAYVRTPGSERSPESSRIAAEATEGPDESLDASTRCLHQIPHRQDDPKPGVDPDHIFEKRRWVPRPSAGRLEQGHFADRCVSNGVGRPSQRRGTWRDGAGRAPLPLVEWRAGLSGAATHGRPPAPGVVHGGYRVLSDPPWTRQDYPETRSYG